MSGIGTPFVVLSENYKNKNVGIEEKRIPDFTWTTQDRRLVRHKGTKSNVNTKPLEHRL